MILKKKLFHHLWFFLGLLLVLGVVENCSRSVDDEGHILLEPVGDPLILPYHFVPSVKLYAIWSDFLVPMYFTDDGLANACLIRNRWRFPDTETAVIFCKDIAATRSIEQYNIPALDISYYYAYDYDQDGADEIALCYTSRDSAWLEIVNSQGERLFRKFLATGEDRDGNGTWDGNGYICDVYDFNGDGYVEILAAVDVGYDLYPRRLFCLDWHNGHFLWQYELSSILDTRYTRVFKPSEDESPVVIVAVQSKGNAAVAGDMDDLHAYLVVLDKNGEEVWKTVTGETFANSRAAVINFDDDNVPDILTCYRYADTTSSSKTKSMDGGMLVVYNLKGEKLYERDMGLGRIINSFHRFDYDGDGVDEVGVVGNDNCFCIFDEKLRLLRKFKSYSQLVDIFYRDFLGDGTRQFVITTDNKLWLLNKDFEPLAQFGPDEIGDLKVQDVFKPVDSLPVYSPIVSDRIRTFNYVMTLESSPWHTIFSRNPLLAFLAAFVPLSIIILVIWFIMAKFRQKNIVIERQRDRLDAALAELKDAQEKLIAAEKYKQARDIAGGFAHEIRNALFPARSSLKQLKSLSRKAKLDNDHVEKYAKNSERAVARAVDITKLISQYTRLDSEYTPEPVNLSQMVKELVQTYETTLEEKGIKLELTGATDVVKVESNYRQLYLVLNNLMLNSIDSLTNRENRVIFITVKEDEVFVTLSFKDNGCGISPENLNRIFDTFYSTKPDKGTGLGLALTKKIVEMYGGSITVTSELDKGTRFDLKLKKFQNSR